MKATDDEIDGKLVDFSIDPTSSDYYVYLQNTSIHNSSSPDSIKVKDSPDFGTGLAEQMVLDTSIPDNDNFLINTNAIDFDNNLSLDFSEASDSASLQIISNENNGLITEFHDTIYNKSFGTVSSTDSIEFPQTLSNHSFNDKYKTGPENIVVKGALEAYEVTDPGFGFNGIEDPALVSYSNSEVSHNDFSYNNSHTITNGGVYAVEIVSGGENYISQDNENNGSIFGFLDNNVPQNEFKVQVTSQNDGILSSVNIVNGGENYAENQEITVRDQQGNTGIVTVSDIDNGHIQTMSILDEGSGFINQEIVSGKNTVLDDEDEEITPSIRVNVDEVNGTSVITTIQQINQLF